MARELTPGPDQPFELVWTGSADRIDTSPRYRSGRSFAIRSRLWQLIVRSAMKPALRKPRNRILRMGRASLPQPKASSMRLRIRWLAQ